MDPAPTRLCDLSPEQLDWRARGHVDGFFSELRGAGDHVRTEWHPLALAKKHPVATAAVIGVAGLAAARLFRGKRRAPRAAASAEPIRAAEPLGRAVGRTLISTLAATAATVLPELLMAYLRRHGAGRSGGAEG